MYKFDAEEKQGNSHFFSMLVPLVQMTEDFISLERMEAFSQALLSKGNEKSALGEMADLLEEEDTVDTKTVQELIAKEVEAKVNKLNGDFKKKLLKDYNTVMQKNSFGGGARKNSPSRALKKRWGMFKRRWQQFEAVEAETESKEHIQTQPPS